MLCIPTPNHRKLVEDCYPPSKKLSGTDSPDSNSLGKLVYYAQSKPAKLTKVGTVLQDRTAIYAKSPSSDKNRAGLLVSLAILKSLIQECSRDITYIAKSAQTILLQAVQASAKAGVKGTRDLDLSARVASTFFAYTSALDHSRNPLDGQVGQSYQALLGAFGGVATDASPDRQAQNKFRLIGIGALSGAVSSDVLYTSTFAQQARTIVPPLFANIAASNAPIDTIEAEAQKTSAGTPSFAEFASHGKKRPGHARAPSLSKHVAGEKGPETDQVISAAMGVLQNLFRNADATQIQDAMKAFFYWMDGHGRARSEWSNEDWACFVGKTLARWTSLQYRFVVLTSLVEELVECCDGPSTAKHATLLAMIAEILQSKDLTLIGLSTSDTLNNLAGLTVRRAFHDIKDPLLPQLVECIESLATHIYYADQLSDVTEELVARIVTLMQPDTEVSEVAKTAHYNRNRVLTQPSTGGEDERMEAARILLFALARVFIVANSAERGTDRVSEATEQRDEAKGAAKQKSGKKGKGIGPALGISVTGTRSRVQPDVLAPTAALLASHYAPIRLAEAQMLSAYLRLEAVQTPASSVEAASLVHAISAAAHVALTSTTLVIPDDLDISSGQEPLKNLVILERANEAEEAEVAQDDSAAVPVDYSALAEVFTQLTKKLSAAALLAEVPALLAIDQAAARKLVPDGESPSITGQRRLATRTFLGRVWSAIGTQWEVAAVIKEAANVKAAIVDELPPVPTLPIGLALPVDSELFDEDEEETGEGSAAAKPVFNRRTIVTSLAASADVREATALGASELAAWFERDWNVGIAVDDAAIGASPYQEPGADAAGGSGVGEKRTRQLNLKTVSDMPPNARTKSSGVEAFREALGNGGHSNGRAVPVPVPVKSDVGGAEDGPLDENGDPIGLGLPPSASQGNGGPLSASSRRASKRVSRQAAGGTTTSDGASIDTNNARSSFLGNTGRRTSATHVNGVKSLLDSFGIASENVPSATGPSLQKGIQEESKPALVPPHAA